LKIKIKIKAEAPRMVSFAKLFFSQRMAGGKTPPLQDKKFKPK
jgi:hypothetical protein